MVILYEMVGQGVGTYYKGCHIDTYYLPTNFDSFKEECMVFFLFYIIKEARSFWNNVYVADNEILITGGENKTDELDAKIKAQV